MSSRSRQKAPPPNLIERAIGALSPQWALRRHKARLSMVMTGGYAGAGWAERMAYWDPGVLDADGDSTRDLRMLRSRSRDLVRNSPIAGGAVETEATYVVGAGLKMQSRINAKVLGISDDEAAAWQAEREQRFKTWAESTYCDVTCEQSFDELQDLAYRAAYASGDCAVVLARKPRQDWPWSLALQVIEADRIANENFAADRPPNIQGVERADDGEVIALHIASHHPGTTVPTSAIKWQRITVRGSSGRRNILHLKRKIRPGQTRGIPALAPIIATLKQMTRYSDAEIDAAVNSAAQAVFVKMDPDSFSELFDDDAQAQYMTTASRWDGTLRSGAAVNLLPGESIEAPALGRPNPNFDPFMQAFMRFVGMGLNIPVEVLMKHFQSSYSAARAALLDAWRTFTIRRSWLIKRLCQPVYEEWLADDIAIGGTVAPGFFDDPVIRAAWCGSLWTGDGPGALDPLKEAKAAQERVNMGLSSLAEEKAAYDGGDWEATHRQRAREHEERVEAGLEPPVTYPAPTLAVPIPPDDGDELDEPPEDEEPEETPTEKAMGVMAAALATMAGKEHSITVHCPPVSVQPPGVTVNTPPVHVTQGDVHLTVPAPDAPQLPEPPGAWTLVRDEQGNPIGMQRG